MNVRSCCAEYLYSDTEKLATLNNFLALLKSVLIDLCECNYLHGKTSLRARWIHACHSVRNLSSPEMFSIPMFFYV